MIYVNLLLLVLPMYNECIYEACGVDTVPIVSGRLLIDRNHFGHGCIAMNCDKDVCFIEHRISIPEDRQDNLVYISPFPQNACVITMISRYTQPS